VVLDPMDLGTISYKLEQGEYKEPQDFVEDVNLVWSNTYDYYKKDTQIYNYAKRISAEFNARIRSIREGTSLNLSLKSETEDDSSDYCGKCQEGGELLICDGNCRQAYHLDCVGLTNEPTTSKWYCERCKKKPQFGGKISTTTSKAIADMQKQILASRKASSGNSSATSVTAATAIQVPHYSHQPYLPGDANTFPWFHTQKQSYDKNFTEDKKQYKPFTSEALKVEEKLYKEHIQKVDQTVRNFNTELSSMPKTNKVKRRTVEEMVRKSHMYYDPFWCVWRPKSKEQFAKTVVQIESALETDEEEIEVEIAHDHHDEGELVKVSRLYQLSENPESTKAERKTRNTRKTRVEDLDSAIDDKEENIHKPEFGQESYQVESDQDQIEKQEETKGQTVKRDTLHQRNIKKRKIDPTKKKKPNPIGPKEYICPCGKSFPSSQHKAAHCKGCAVYQHVRITGVLPTKSKESEEEPLSSGDTLSEGTVLSESDQDNEDEGDSEKKDQDPAQRKSRSYAKFF